MSERRLPRGAVRDRGGQRLPVRLLHAWLGDEHVRPSREEPHPICRGGRAALRWQLVQVYRLPAHPHSVWCLCQGRQALWQAPEHQASASVVVSCRPALALHRRGEAAGVVQADIFGRVHGRCIAGFGQTIEAGLREHSGRRRKVLRCARQRRVWDGVCRHLPDSGAARDGDGHRGLALRRCGDDREVDRDARARRGRRPGLPCPRRAHEAHRRCADPQRVLLGRQCHVHAGAQ
mmetsp:Transcript_9400/g.26818  ORF Transcript_9400/g.26818 Transcript_9400/m.26818 type:complete len:234 (-) Transcript_9400:799-1500(-)